MPGYGPFDSLRRDIDPLPAIGAIGQGLTISISSTAGFLIPAALKPGRFG
jgi:hypothetical protein